jgi:hypothetical protein
MDSLDHCDLALCDSGHSHGRNRNAGLRLGSGTYARLVYAAAITRAG